MPIDITDVTRRVAVWGWSTLPDQYAISLWIGAHTFPWRPVSPPRNVTRRIVASDNVEMLRRIARDPHMIWRTRIDAIYGLVRLMEAASDRAGALQGDIASCTGRMTRSSPAPPRSVLLNACRRRRGPRCTPTGGTCCCGIGKRRWSTRIY